MNVEWRRTGTFKDVIYEKAAEGIAKITIDRPRVRDQVARRVDADRFDSLRTQHAAEAAFATPDIECVPERPTTEAVEHRRIEDVRSAIIAVLAHRRDPRRRRLVPAIGHREPPCSMRS